MDITPSEAADILQQIEQNQWKWLKLKRFTPDAYTTLEDRYSALEQHHGDETQRLIEVVKGLCRTVELLKDSH